MALLLYLIVNMVNASRVLTATTSITNDITATLQGSEITHALQNENDIVVFYKATNGSELLGLPDAAYTVSLWI